MSDGATARAIRATSTRWYFYEATGGGWQWDHIDENGTLIARAPRPFDSRTACVADAKAHGYGVNRQS